MNFGGMYTNNGFTGGSVVRICLLMQEMQVQSLGQDDPLEKEMATHSSILAWEIHGQRSLVGYSRRSHRVRHNRMTEHIHRQILCLLYFFFFP